jgi:hypothetical protein
MKHSQADNSSLVGQCLSIQRGFRRASTCSSQNFPLRSGRSPRRGRAYRDGNASLHLEAVYGGGFAATRLRAMELITILKPQLSLPAFVYQHAHFIADKKSIEVAVRPRKGPAAVCSRCHLAAPGYDQLAERRFEFIALSGFLVTHLASRRESIFLLPEPQAWDRSSPAAADSDPTGGITSRDRL